MIKINLKDDYIDVNIKNVFHRIAKSITEKLNCNGPVADFKLYDNEDNIMQINEENIYQFLINKQFYKYNFKILEKSDKKKNITNKIIKDFLKLPSAFAFSSLQKPKIYSKEDYRNFHKNYFSCNIEFFNNLKGYFLKKEKNPKIMDADKVTFLKEYYWSYFLIKKAFSYTTLKNVDTDRDIILSKMNVNVCPYCNLNYTLNYRKKMKNRASADLDHFYVKSYYPMYALCLYNFIPSCQICNSRLKLNKDMTIKSYIYPHKNSFSNKGVFKISNLVEYTLSECNNLQIKLNNLEDDDKIKKSSELFCIEERYQYFESFAKELLSKVIIYNDSYQKELEEILGDSRTIDTKTFIFGKKLTEEDILNESLGKFRMDLLKEFGVYQ